MNAVAYMSAAKTNNAGALVASLKGMLPFFHTYSTVIIAVEKAGL